MFDFRLTKTGDLDCINDQPLSKFHLTFSLSKYKAQRINFVSIPNVVPPKKKGAQKIIFRTMQPMDPYKIKELNARDFEEAIQAIMIALRTELSDTIDYDIGSRLYQKRHSIFTGQEDELKDIGLIVSSVVGSILPDASAKVEYGEHKDAGYFKFQCLIITIRYEDESETIYMY